jgi:hypothetical protein
MRESIERQIELETDILNKLKEQNPNIEIVDDIMIEVADSWGGTVVPYYGLFNKTDSKYLELHTKEVVRYFDFNDGDLENITDNHFSDYLSNIRSGKYKDLILKIDYQYPSEQNGWKSVILTDERKEVLSDLEERLKYFNYDVEYEYGDVGLPNDSVENSKRLWKLSISMPVKLNLGNKISRLDRVSKNFIKDFETFVKDYKIDDKGVDRLSNLLRNFKQNHN